MKGIIDIHSHIIPFIDDGAKDEQMALEMLQIAEKAGTKQIILTPHYYKGKFTKTIGEVREKLIYMQNLAYENGLKLELYAGQEVYFTPSLLQDLDDGEIGTLNDTRYMLIEFNMMDIDSIAMDVLYELKFRGIVPVIAHPERYIQLQKDPSMINEFINEGCIFQLNAGSINGLLGKEAKKTAEIFLRNNIYSFIGSDAHSNGRRDTDLSKYKEIIEKIQNGFMESANGNAQKLLNDEKVIFKGRKIEKKKGFFSFFKK